MDEAALKAQIKQLIVDTAFLKISPDAIGDEDNLLEVHGVDSVYLFEILVGLEDICGVSLEDQEFDVETFSTVDSIVGFVQSLQAQG